MTTYSALARCSAALVLGVVALAAPQVAAHAEQTPSDGPVVQTSDGPVQGAVEGDLTVFRGIPYAAPPVAERRFQAPATPKPWQDPLETKEFGPACPQSPDDLELPEGEPMSEDCLTLNVWTQSVRGDAPVIVFIPGGGFIAGTASNPWYDGADLASRGATVVSIQYRVGPLGWLNLSSLGSQYAQSMNNGLLDQMAALRWVRKNIAEFGGDPSNVTVAGESAGAISISALLGVPDADDLYDRVILQSGTTGTVATREWSEGVAREFTKFAGVSDPEALLGLGTEDLLKAADEVYASQFADTAFHPVVDGTLLPDLPAKRVAAQDGPTKPVLIGTTLDEGRYWLYYLPELNVLPRVYYEPWLESLVGDRADAVFTAYQTERPELTDSQIGLALAGDVGFRMPAIRMAESLSARGVDVHMYLATVQSIGLDGIMGSPHAVELPFVFGTTAAASDFVADSEENRALSDRVQDLWVTFAQDGKPKTGGETWPRYDSTTRSTLILDPALRVEDDPYPAAREAWGSLSFDGANPGLDRLTPLQYEGTNQYHPMVIGAVIGWQWIWLGVAALVLIVVGVVWFLKRRRRARAQRAAPLENAKA